MQHIKDEISNIEKGICPIGKFRSYSDYPYFCPECQYADLNAVWTDLASICKYQENPPPKQVNQDNHQG